MKTDPLETELEEVTARVRERARAELGVTGTVDTTPLRRVLRENGLSLYPLMALSVLALINAFQGYGVDVLSPDISRGLGLGIGAIVAARSLTILAVSLSPLPMAWLTQRKARRAWLSIVTGVLWSVITIFTGFVVGLGGLLFVLLFDGLTSGSVYALHYPLLMDSYPPNVRMRVASAYTALGDIGLANVMSPLLVALLTALFSMTWRGVFLVLGILSLLGTVTSFRLRDPGFGHFDTERIRKAVHETYGDAQPAAAASAPSLRFFEIMRRLLLIPTIRRLLFGIMVLGIFTIPLNTFLSFFLDERFGLGATGRGFFFAGLSFCGVIALALFARRGEAMYRKDPSRVLRLSGLILVAEIAVYGLAPLVPGLVGVVTLFCIGGALQVLLYPMLNVAALSVVEARWRAHLAALVGIFVSAGGLLGSLFLSGIDRRFGLGGALVSLTIPGVVGALMIASAGRFVNDDLDRLIHQVAEDEEISRITSANGHLAMLSCKGIDFSYGKLQVLFGVDFTVDDGELVALLGVNGAGKSTLLKVVSGIGLPSRGTVRFHGNDVTYLDAERRLRLGITQVPGGRAVFAPLSVVDNLRVFGYALDRSAGSIDDAIERCFAAFPQLERRRNQHAGTLSGGEQQMLGLCKALILRPRLLLIDELSLGLAPVVVGQLLDMVREINAAGTAVVLVEQSVNIALSIAHHAYFMERGEIRFDGRSSDLLQRTDLLRAVFLEGAARSR